MARPNPFGDYSTIDLSSIYAASQGPGGGVAATGGAAGGAAGGTTGGTAVPPDLQGAISALGLPASPLATDPAASNASVNSYWATVASDLLGGKYSPYQLAAGNRGQNTANRPGGDDASPEANLPSMAYVGTVLNSVLTPEQRAQIQYNTPELAAWLEAQVAAGRGDSIGLTRQNLQNAYNAGSGAFAGSAADLLAATQTVRQADYAQYVARLKASGITFIPSQADYERGMGLQPLTASGYQPTGVPTTNQNGTASGMIPVQAQTPVYTNVGMGTSGTTGGTTTGTTSGGATPASVDYKSLADTARRYANNLLTAYTRTGDKSLLDRATEYFKRADEYQARATTTTTGTASSTGATAGTGGTTTGTTSGTTSGSSATGTTSGTTTGTTSGTTTAAPSVDYTKAIATNQTYVDNILAVPEAQRTEAQKASLAAAQARISDYQARMLAENNASGTTTGSSQTATIGTSPGAITQPSGSSAIV